MKLLLSSVLLASLCSLSSWSISALTVHQSPDVSVVEGETVNISCCYMRKGGRGRITWFKNQTVFKNETVIIIPSNSSNEQTNTCSTLTFSNITTNDVGRYVCEIKVEIPTLETARGNGTVINVTTRQDKADKTPRDSAGSPPVHVIVVLAVMLPLLVLALTCFVCLRRKQGHGARVIYEAPHSQDSEEAEMDKHSTSSSRGSSQWCQVTVYDSIDYFQQVETKRSEEGSHP